VPLSRSGADLPFGLAPSRGSTGRCVAPSSVAPESDATMATSTTVSATPAGSLISDQHWTSHSATVLPGKFLTIMIVAMALASGPAFGCKGVNKLLEDDFSNPESGWVEKVRTMAIKDGKLQLTTEPKRHSSASYEGDFFNNADACVTVIAPDVKDASIGVAGLMFYLTNSYDFYAFVINPTGQAAVLRLLNGDFLTPVPPRKAEGIKAGGNSSNVLRVTWNNGSIATYVNDRPFTTLKAKPPRNGKIGLYAESAGATWSFANVLVTDPQR
jgi:hypothetical protein